MVPSGIYRIEWEEPVPLTEEGKPVFNKKGKLSYTRKKHCVQFVVADWTDEVMVAAEDYEDGEEETTTPLHPIQYADGASFVTLGDGSRVSVSDMLARLASEARDAGVIVVDRKGWETCQ